MIKRHLFFSLAISVLIIGCYSNSLDGKFFLDDFRNIHSNTHVKIDSITLENLVQAATLSPCNTRWLPNISLALNYYFGGLHPVGYKIFNFGVHISTAVALYFLFFLTLSLSQRFENIPVKAGTIAFAAATLWAVHPLQTNGVSYIVQRMTSMAALFFVLAVVCYIRARGTEGKRRILWWTGCAASAACAFVSKENTLVLPLLIWVYDIFFFQRGAQKREGLKITVIGAALILLSFLITWLVLGHNPFDGVLNGYKHRSFTLQERLLTEPRVIFQYLTLVVLPLPSRLILAYDFPLSHSLFQPIGTFFALLGVLGLCGTVPVLFKRNPIISFSVFWFLFNHIVESTIMPLEIAFEHRMYLPDMFLFLPPVLWIDSLIGKFTQKTGSGTGQLEKNDVGAGDSESSHVFIAVVLMVSTVLGVLTYQRNNVWNDELSFWEDLTKKSPGLSRGYVELGLSLQERGDYPSAIAAFNRAIVLEPNNGAAWLDLGYVKEQQGDLKGSLEYYFKALDKPMVGKHIVYNNISRILLKQGSYKEGLDWALKAKEVEPYFSAAWGNLGVAYDFLGRPEEAEGSFYRASELAPNEAHGYYRLALFLYRQKKFTEAMGIVEKGIAATGDGNETLFSLRRKINAELGK